VNVIGVTNPYAGCTGNLLESTPTVKFGIALPFNATNSSVLSLDGNVLYLIESRPPASGGAILYPTVPSWSSSPPVFCPNPDFVYVGGSAGRPMRS
jgi:hypothetical protein